MNIVLLRGKLSSPPRIRELPSGDDLGQFEVTTDGVESASLTVPVVVLNPSPSVAALAPDTEIVATGVVRRRFYRQGGITRSATEVVADRLVPARQARRAGQALDRALAAVSR